MAKLAQFRRLVADFEERVDFLIVYIDEAHPSDGWKFEGNAYDIANHVDIEARLAAAGRLAENRLPCEMVVDSMSNRANKSYSAAPEKFVVIGEGGKVEYIGRMGPVGYRVEEVREWIESYLKHPDQLDQKKGE